MKSVRFRLSGMFTALIFLMTFLVGCNLAVSPTPIPTVIGEPEAVNEPAVTTGPSGPTYTNPVYDNDFPDPHILRVGDAYFGYSTNAANANIQVVTSENLVTWERHGDALPALPQWAAPNFGLTWAPGVIQLGDAFVMYYTTRDTNSDLQCVSVGVSGTPTGPFSDDSTEPFICQTELGGSIDPYPFRDEDGQLYLLWKNDGNCCGYEIGLWVQPLSDDGLSLVGEPTELIRRDQAWERPLIENPAMVKDGDNYYLFYSANWWESHEYAIGYAVCETMTGPCTKPLTEPLFGFTPQVMGPGGEAFFTDTEGNLWMAYHAWTGANVGYPGGERSLRIEPVTFVDGRPIIPGPTHEPQPFH